MAIAEAIRVKHGDSQVHFEPVACRIYMGGEFAGNVELELHCESEHAGWIEECLRIRLPGESEALERIATGNPGAGIELVFGSEALTLRAEAPEAIEILWNDESVGRVPCELTDSVPLLRDYSYLQAAQILPNPELPTENRVCLAANRGWLWMLPGCGLLLASVLMLALGSALLSDIARAAWVAALGLLGVGMLGLGASVPNRQVWLDRQAHCLTVERVRRLGRAEPDVGARRALSEFAHVRVLECHYWDSEGGDIEEWSVSLEGPIPYALEQGGVHRRQDALLIETFGGGRAAMRRAAEIAHLTGLPILEARDH